MNFNILDLGLVGYQEALTCQEKLLSEVSLGESPSTLILCEHHPTVTLGRSAHLENILKTESELERLGVSFYKTSRGGDVTLHLPGQLVAYPIFDLKALGRDIHKFLRALEEVVIRLLADYKILGERVEGLSGVWVKNRKISSLGIAVRRWVVMHGLSLNINCDLSLFSLIRSCGQDIMLTSMEREVTSLFPSHSVGRVREGDILDKKEIKDKVIKNFKDVFKV